MRHFATPRAAALFVATLALGTTLALSGCSGASRTQNHPFVNESTDTRTAEAPTPSTGGSTLPAVKSAGSVPLTCDNPAIQLPGWTLATGATPASGSSAAAAAGAGGIACQWTDANGKQVTVGIAHPTSSSIAALENYFGTAGYTPVADLGSKGYFRTAKGAGDAEVIAGSYWISAVSPGFTSGSDASSIVSALTGALPSG